LVQGLSFGNEQNGSFPKIRSKVGSKAEEGKQAEADRWFEVEE